MSSQENKFLLLLLCVFSFFSCTNNSKKTQHEWIVYKNYSSQFVSQELYKQVLQEANDSVKIWISNHLPNYSYERNNDWKIDSVLCFNKNADKCIMALMVRDTLYKPANSDGISYFYGVKIRNAWYFFKGPFLVLPREYYQEDIHMPLPFEKMKELAAKHVYRGYLKKNPLWKKHPEAEEYVINERFFADFTSVAWCIDCVTQEQWNKAYLKWVNKNWENRDTVSVIR